METNQNAIKIAVNNYGRVLFICAVVALGSVYMKVPSNILTIKLLVTPMFWLSFQGLNSLFRHPIVEEKVTVRKIEYFAIWAFLFSAFIIIVIWTPDISVQKMMSGVFVGTVVGVALQLLFSKLRKQ